MKGDPIATRTTDPQGESGADAVRRFLDEHGVDYLLLEHGDAYTAAAEARAADAAPETGAKTVMLHDPDGYLMAVVRASDRLDVKKVRRLTHRPGLQLAAERELADEFASFEVGALPPFGSLFGVPEIVDRQLLAQERIVCNGGDHRHSIVIDAGDVVRAAQPDVADIVVAAHRPGLAGRTHATMLALQLTRWQHPPELREVAVPDPGPGEVLIKIGGAGACHSDLHLMEWPEGQLDFQPPFTLGHENAGWVEAIGAGVRGLQRGDAVAVYGPWGCGHCAACRRSSENYCERQRELRVMGGGLGLDGGMAEYMLVPSSRLLLPLGELDPREAAPLSDAALTPYHAIKRSLHKLSPGSTAVVIGVGGLGNMAVQILAAVSPAQIVAVDTSPAKLALAAEAGAAVTVEAGEGAAEQIQDATHGRGAELVIDVVGSDDTLALAAQSGRFEGDVALVGLAGGELPVSFFSQPYECSISTTYWGSAIELMEVLELARSGRIRTHVERFALRDAMEAYERLRRGDIAGRAVVCPHDDIVPGG